MGNFFTTVHMEVRVNIVEIGLKLKPKINAIDNPELRNRYQEHSIEFSLRNEIEYD